MADLIISYMSGGEQVDETIEQFVERGDFRAPQPTPQQEHEQSQSEFWNAWLEADAKYRRQVWEKIDALSDEEISNIVKNPDQFDHETHETAELVEADRRRKRIEE